MRPIAALRAPKRLPFLQVLKTTVAAVGAWLLAGAAFPATPPVFATIAALLVVQPSVNQSLARALERSAGVVLGVVIAVAGSALLGTNALTALVVIAAAVVLSWAARLSPGSGNQVAISAMLVIALGATTPGYALDRVLETLLGAAVGLVVNAAVAPPSLVAPAVTAVARLGDVTADVMEALGGALREPRTTAELDLLLADARALRTATDRAAAALEAGGESLMLNPLRSHHRRRIDEAAAVHARLRAVVQRLVAMTRTLHDHWRPELVGAPLALGIAQELERTAHDLRLLASPGASGQDTEPPLLTEPLQVLAAPRLQWILIGSLLEDLRRMREEIVDGIEERDAEVSRPS